MKNVKAKIIKDLQDALVELNMSDMVGDDDYENDLAPGLSRQNSAYGDVSDALRKIGGDDMVEFWIENGEFQEA